MPQQRPDAAWPVKNPPSAAQHHRAMADLRLVLSALATLGVLTTVAAVYKLAAPEYGSLQLPSNVLLTTSKLETNGTATVAVATRKLYRCVSYASVLSTYNSVDEEIIAAPPSKQELIEWVSKNKAKIGATVSGGVGSDFTPCSNGSSFLYDEWVDSSEITKNCYPSHTFRYACFMSWYAHFKLIHLPVFMNTSNSELAPYIISPAGSPLPARKHEYDTHAEHAVLIVHVPERITTDVDVNCFVNQKEITCIEPASNHFLRFAIPAQFPRTDIMICQFHFCLKFSSITIKQLIDLQSDVLDAHKQSTSTLLNRRKRSTDNVLPTEPASYADLLELQDHVHVLRQSDVYNVILLYSQQQEITRIQHHIILNLAKIDDSFLSKLWGQSFLTHFLNYDHFTIKPFGIPYIRNSNCNKNKTEIYLAGRFVQRTDKEICYSWEQENVTEVSVVHAKNLVLPMYSKIRHTSTQQDFSWSYLMGHRSGMEEGSMLRQFGGVRNSAILDLQNFGPGTLFTSIFSLFGLSGFSSISVSALILMVVIANCTRRQLN